MSTNITTHTLRLLSDTVTLVSIFLKIRDRFLSPCLLESNDYRSAENSSSIIGFEPLARIEVKQKGLLRLGQTKTLKASPPLYGFNTVRDFETHHQHEPRSIIECIQFE